LLNKIYLFEYKNNDFKEIIQWKTNLILYYHILMI
jgi:hypothetical protein